MLQFCIAGGLVLRSHFNDKCLLINGWGVPPITLVKQTHRDMVHRHNTADTKDYMA